MDDLHRAAFIVLAILFLWIVWNSKPTYETLVSKPSGNIGYARFYSDFDGKDLLFEVNGRGLDALVPKYFKYAYRGDIRAMDISLPASGPPGREVRIYAYYYPNTTSTTTSDFYNIYQIPEHTYRTHPNLQLVATVKPGQRYQSSDVPGAKHFLIKMVL